MGFRNFVTVIIFVFKPLDDYYVHMVPEKTTESASECTKQLSTTYDAVGALEEEYVSFASSTSDDNIFASTH